MAEGIKVIMFDNCTCFENVNDIFEGPCKVSITVIKQPQLMTLLCTWAGRHLMTSYTLLRSFVTLLAKPFRAIP